MVSVTSESLGDRPAVVEVSESFRGLGTLQPGALVPIRTAVWTMLGGREYIFYARRQDGVLTVRSCDRTRPIHEASEDLAYARGLATSTVETARILGELRWNAQALVDGRSLPPDPLPTGSVIITGGGVERRLTTDADGRFETQVPPGTYRARVDLPPNYQGGGDRGTFTIVDPRACHRLGVAVDWNGHLTGRVVDAGGEPVAGVGVHYTSDAAGRSVVMLGRVRTREDGTFQIDRLERGEHDVRIGVDLLPTEETIRLTPQLGPGERIDLGTLRLPARARLATVRGVVRDRAGAPVAGARLRIQEVGKAPEFAAAWTDGGGRYVFAAVAGRRYVVALDDDNVSDAEPEPIEAGAVAGPPPIVLRPVR
ncbi:MAG: carboxypeptidase-like regulatory domain-containing protein [Vicinamibacteraceae bacterium]